MCCDLLILAERFAEPVVPSNCLRVARRRLGGVVGGAERAVRPMAVVVLGVLGQHCRGIPLAGDEDAAEEFAADAVDGVFGAARPFRASGCDAAGRPGDRQAGVARS
jgi:hypothetical protein